MTVPAIQELGSSRSVHEMTFSSDTTIDEAAPEMVNLANSLQRPVAARIKSITITVDPGTTAQQVKDTYSYLW